MSKPNLETYGISKLKKGYRIRLGRQDGKYALDKHFLDITTLAQAQKIRDAAVKKLNKQDHRIIVGKRNGNFLTKPTGRNSSGYIGVSWHRAAGGNNYWVANLMNCGEKLKKFYSIKIFGNQAFYMALKKRQEWERKYRKGRKRNASK